MYIIEPTIVRITQVNVGSQAERAGLVRGDIITYPGTNGQVPIPYEFFLNLAKSSCRPVIFDAVRRDPRSSSKSSSSVKRSVPGALADQPNGGTSIVSSLSTDLSQGGSKKAKLTKAPVDAKEPPKKKSKKKKKKKKKADDDTRYEEVPNDGFCCKDMREFSQFLSLFL